MIKIKVISKKDIESRDISFMEHDVCGAMEKLFSTNVPIIDITSYEGTQEDKYNQIKNALNILKDIDCIIITTAYISTYEYPPTEYYFPGDNDTSSRKILPVDDILKKNSEFLENIGFISINHYVQYESRVAYIYANDNGKKINNYLKELNNSFHNN